MPEKNNNYEYLKDQYMDGDTREKMNEYVEWYKSSKESKESGNPSVLDLWKTSYDYWEGNANIAVYADDPASNTNIVHKTVEGQVALMVDQNISIQPTSYTVSEKPYIDQIRIMLEWVKYQNRMVRKMDRHERHREVFGTGIMRVLFDDRAVNGIGLPVIDVVNPAYVYPDPNVSTVYGIQDGRFVIEMCHKPIIWARRTFGEKAEAIEPRDSSNQDFEFGEDTGNQNNLSAQYYVHLYVWEKVRDKNGKTKLIMTEMSADGVKLSCTEDENIGFPSEDFPYFFTPLYAREGTVWGKSDVELLYDVQDIINDLDDQIRRNARLTGNPQKVIDPSSGVKVDMIDNSEGAIIVANGGREAIFNLEAQSIAPYIVNRRDRSMDVDASAVTRFHEQMVGGKMRGVESATEAMAMQESGMSGIDHKKNLLQETLVDVFTYIYECCLYYYNKEIFFKITNSDAKTEETETRLNPSKLNAIPEMTPATSSFKRQYKKSNPRAKTPEYQTAKIEKEDGSFEDKKKKAQIGIQITVGTAMPKNQAFVYQVYKEAVAMGAMDLGEFRAYLKTGLGIPIDDKKTEELKAKFDAQQQQQNNQNMTGIKSQPPQKGGIASKKSTVPMPNAPTPKGVG